MFRHLARTACVLVIAAGPAVAGDVTGSVELPAAPPPPPVALKGFLDRAENPLLPVKSFDPTPYLVVVLVPATAPAAGTGTASWDLVGESFARPVVPVQVGTEVTVRNKSKRAVTIAAIEDPALISAGPINPQGSRAFTPKATGLLTLTDADIPHLRGRLVVVDTPYVAVPERSGKFEVKDVPPGEYKVRLWYLDGWLERPDDSVTVGAKGNASVSPRVPAGWKLKAK